MSDTKRFWIVGKDRHGMRYANSFARLGYDRALRICNESREAGDTYTVAFHGQDLMVAVTPWDAPNALTDAMIDDARAWLAWTLNPTSSPPYPLAKNLAAENAAQSRRVMDLG